MISLRNMAMVRPFNPTIMAFGDLPLGYQMAVTHYLAIDGEAWSVPSGHSRITKKDLERFARLNSFFQIGVVSIPRRVLEESIMADFDLDEFRSFSDYHRWCISQKFMPNHKNHDWPSILSQMEDETFEDGWHRFHSYYRQGLEIFPCAFFPRND